MGDPSCRALGAFRALGILILPGCLISPRVMYVGLALLGFGGLAFIYTVDPRDPGNYPVCPFLGLTGCYCPGCGTLRALHGLTHGDVARAFGYNPLATLSLPFIAYSYATAALQAFRVPVPRPVFLHPRWIWTLLAGVIVFWVLRNVSVYPLSALAP